MPVSVQRRNGIMVITQASNKPTHYFVPFPSQATQPLKRLSTIQPASRNVATDVRRS